jgi:thiol-disulfide isomerase/thioredoxin
MMVLTFRILALISIFFTSASGYALGEFPEITHDNWEVRLKKAHEESEIVVVMTTAVWCTFCKYMVKDLKTVQEKLGNKISIFEIDHDKLPKYSKDDFVRWPEPIYAVSTSLPGITLFDKNLVPFALQNGFYKDVDKLEWMKDQIDLNAKYSIPFIGPETLKAIAKRKDRKDVVVFVLREDMENNDGDYDKRLPIAYTAKKELGEKIEFYRIWLREKDKKQLPIPLTKPGIIHFRSGKIVQRIISDWTKKDPAIPSFVKWVKK